jgi:hypothetical protein
LTTNSGYYQLFDEINSTLPDVLSINLVMATILARRRANTRGLPWTEREQRVLLEYLRKKKYKVKDLNRMFPKRSAASIRSKVRKLRVKNDLFGNSYRQDKLDFTKGIADATKPEIIFEAYAGAGHQTFEWIKTANTIHVSEAVQSKLTQFRRQARKNGFRELKTMSGVWKKFKRAKKTIYHYTGDAVDAATFLKSAHVKIDLVDLDTCGSTIPTIPLFLTLLKPKHLIITHGEFHSLRFKRDDVLRRLLVHLDIKKSVLPLTVDKMAKHLDKSVKLSALRSHNETPDSFWMDLKGEKWIGGKFQGMLRRHYEVSKPSATADCINDISQ